MLPPVLTAEQRQAALASAIAARKARSELLAELGAGRVTLAQVLDRGDEATRRIKVESLLRALPGHGPIKAAEIMQRCGISPRRRIGGLGPAQRRKLLATT